MAKGLSVRTISRVALAPDINDKALTRTDFPAPDSPVMMLKPLLKSMATSLKIAKFLTESCLISGYPSIHF
jgi:hypothetical protein